LIPASEEAIAMTKPQQDRRIDYVELNVTYIARSKAFYGSAFGWSFTDYGPDYANSPTAT
jgi:predicted enzyme related to lactoylglutathione lyase